MSAELLSTDFLSLLVDITMSSSEAVAQVFFKSLFIKTIQPIWENRQVI